MFKKLLLFFVLLTTMVGRMSGATTTYDFYSLASNLGYGEGLAWEQSGNTVRVNGQDCYIYNDYNGFTLSKFAFQGDINIRRANGTDNTTDRGVFNNKDNAERHVVVLNVKKGESFSVIYINGTDRNGSTTNVCLASYGVSLTNGTADVSAGTALTSQDTYYVKDDGNLVLAMGARTYIHNIIIGDAPEIYFDAGTYTANIQDYNQFEEPTLHYPDGATVSSYASSNEKIAKILWDNNVAFRGSGIVTITATVVYNGVTYTPSYNVTVKAEQAEPVVAGNTCTLSGVGRLNPQSAAVPGLYMEFGNISLTDPNKNTTIVQQLYGGNLYATTIDRNGYRPVWKDDSGLPTQVKEGSFYTFKPTVSGTLKVWVNGDYNEDAAYMIESSNPSTKIGETTLNVNVNSNSPKELTFTLDAGKIYYLCNTAQYNPLYLNKVTYEPSFKFSANSACKPNGYAPSVQDPFDEINLVGVSGNVSYSTEIYGNITGATVDANGHITNITYTSGADQGGAVVVHATCDAGTATYVLTVAYTEHLWDFTRTINAEKPHGTPLASENILTELNNNNNNWAVDYKVREYDEVDGKKYFRRLNVPVICNANAIDGTNADYNEYTAGLTITAGAKSFGSNAKIDDAYYDSDGHIYNVNALGLPASEVTEARILTLYKGATLTIPNLTKGQYVRIKWQRYVEGKGDKVTLHNLSDLKWTPMDTPDAPTDFAYVNNIRQGRSGQGYHVFRVKDHGSASFTVADDGWLNIYSIQVSNNFLDDNCWNVMQTMAGSMDTELTFPDATVYTSLTNEEISNGTTSYSWTAQGANLLGQQNISVKYFLEGLDGHGISPTLSGTTVSNVVTKNNNGKVVFSSTFKPVGHGQLVAVSEGFTYQVTDAQFDVSDIEHAKIYYLDLQRTLITVNETGSTAQNYPYTWDFTNISATTVNDRLLKDDGYWTGNATDGFTPTKAYQDAFTENTEITTYQTGYQLWDRSETVSAGNDYYGLAEFDGIGFNTNPVDGYSTSLTSIKITTDGTGLVVGNGSADAKAVTLNIPKVDAGYTVYVRVKENNNASVTVGGESNVGYTDSQTGEKVYTFTTQEETDVPVAVKNAEVKKIAVTKMTKTCWLKDGDTDVYYNTDSHNKPIDYSLTEYFTGHEIKAYTVESTMEDNTGAVNSVILSSIVKAPANHGYIVSTEYSSNPNSANVNDAHLYKRPLFLPSVIDQQNRHGYGKNETGDIMEHANDSYLKPHVGSGPVSESEDTQYDYYVLTNKYYNTYDNTHAVHTVEVPGFYRLESISASLDKNRAYLVLPKQSSHDVKFIPLSDFDGELVDAIDEIPAIVTNGIDVNGTFYTLQGLKIEGFPQKGGIYIQNGKKVIVK